MARMTRARNRTQGLGNPPLIQLWLEAVLCAFVSLVQGAATTLRMIFNRNHRDWHTETADEALPQATSGIQIQESKTTHGVILGLVPRIPVGPTRGLSIDPREAINQDARHKTERDSVDAAPSLSFRTHAQRASRNPGATRTSVTPDSRVPARAVYPEPVEGRVGNDNAGA